MINFDVEQEFQEQIDWVEKFAKEEIEPLDNFFRIGKTKDGNPAVSYTHLTLPTSDLV